MGERAAITRDHCVGGGGATRLGAHSDGLVPITIVNAETLGATKRRTAKNAEDIFCSTLTAKITQKLGVCTDNQCKQDRDNNKR